MGKVISYIRYAVMAEQSAPDWAVEQWLESMQVNSQRINQKRQRKVPDQPRYETLVAETSKAKWKNFVSEDFISKHGLNKGNIVAKHSKQISKGYAKWQKHLDAAFATVDGVEAKKFKESVQGGVGHYAQNMRMTMGLVGDKVRGYGAAVCAAFYLTGEAKALADTHISEKGAGRPIDVTQSGLKGALRAALVAMLVKGGAAIINSEYGESTLVQENIKLNRLMTALADSAKYAKFEPGGVSHVDWVMSIDTGLCLDIQVSSV